MWRYRSVFVYALLWLAFVRDVGSTMAAEPPAYKNVATIVIPTENPIAESQAVSQLRGLLWKRWTTRAASVVKASGHTLEGVQWTTVYRIEERGGKWTLSATSENGTLDAEGVVTPIHEQCVAYTVKRVELRARNNARFRVIADSQTRRPSSYRLLLQDAAGNNCIEL